MDKTHTPNLVYEKTQSTEERPKRSTSAKTEKAWNGSHAVTAVTTSTHEYKRIYIRTEESECNPGSFSCVKNAYQLHSSHYTF